MIRQSVIIFVHALPNIILRMQFERLEKRKRKRKREGYRQRREEQKYGKRRDNRTKVEEATRKTNRNGT